MNKILALVIGGSSIFISWVVTKFACYLLADVFCVIEFSYQNMFLIFLIYQVIEVAICILVVKLESNKITLKFVGQSFLVMSVIATTIYFRYGVQDGHLPIIILMGAVHWLITYLICLYVLHIIKKYSKTY